MYANIPNLMSALRQTGNESDDGVYFGRWPGDKVLDRLKKGIPVKNWQHIKKLSMHNFHN